MIKKLLCRVCAKLDIDLLSLPEGVSYHLSIFQLRESASECRLCQLIYNELSNSKITPFSFHHLLRQDSYTRHIRFRLRLAEERNKILIETFQVIQPDIAVVSPTLTWKENAVVTVALHVWTLSDDPALEYGLPSRRQVGRNTSSEESLSVAKAWLDNCKQQHTRYGGCSFDRVEARHGASHRPTRLIDSSRGFDDLRLVSGTTADPAYTALSYVWGLEKPIWKTVRGNVARRTVGFSIDELPRTLHDAIKVTVALGLHLCWIDALCIVQNDPEEWERESVKMDVIYSSAVVTLMASHASCSTTGLFNERSTSCDDCEDSGVMLESTLSNGKESRLLLTQPPQHKQWLEMVLSTVTNETILFERGWCFQEWMLSPRKLYFSSSQLFWECFPGCLSEDGLWTYQQYHRGLTQALIGYLEGRGQSPQSSWSFGMNSLWYHDFVSQSYSDRQLSNQSDRLIAIAGLAKTMQLARPSRYLAGIWEHSLPGGLCWRRVSSGGKYSQYVAPSWSWASQDAMIEYMIDTIDPKNKHTSCVVEDVWVRTKGGDEMGLVVAGEIRLHAPTFSAKVGMMITEAGYHEIDDDPPLEHVLYPERPASEATRWTVRGLVTDTDEAVEDLPVIAIIVFDDHKQQRLGAVVVQQVGDDVYRRVGFLWTKSSEESRSYLTIVPRTVTII